MSSLKPHLLNQIEVDAQTAIKRILCPIDFSETSHQAFLYALNLAGKVYAEITVVHVIPELHMDPMIVGEKPIATLKRQHQLETQQKFLPYRQEAIRSEVELSSETRYGNPVPEILEVCKDTKADMIIMGTLGENSIHENILGSITSRVIEQAPCPVLAVPNKEFSPDIRNLGYAVELEDMDKDMIQKLMNYAQMFDAQLHCIHVRPQELAWNETELELFRQMYEWEEEMHLLEFHIVSNPDVELGLQQFMEARKIDLLALLSKKHFQDFYKNSFTRKMILHAEIPMIAFGWSATHSPESDKNHSAE